MEGALDKEQVESFINVQTDNSKTYRGMSWRKLSETVEKHHVLSSKKGRILELAAGYPRFLDIYYRYEFADGHITINELQKEICEKAALRHPGLRVLPGPIENLTTEQIQGHTYVIAVGALGYMGLASIITFFKTLRTCLSVTRILLVEAVRDAEEAQQDSFHSLNTYQKAFENQGLRLRTKQTYLKAMGEGLGLTFKIQAEPFVINLRYIFR